MAIYNLEETPDIFITPQFYGNEFQYAMVRFNGENDKVTVRVIDLRNDRLMIYGTEIKETSSKRLYESLVIRPRVGIMYYNCDGACYFRIDGKGVYRPTQNVIFDWSAFGVTIPNSMNQKLRNQLEQKEKVDHLNHQLSSIDVEMKASMEKVESLEGQLSTYKNEEKGMELKLQEACQRVALVEFELELYKIDVESYKKCEDELIEQLCSCKEKSPNMEIELQKVQVQLSSVNCELQSTTIELETSRRCTKEFENQLSTCIKGNQELERELERMEKENCIITFELGKAKSKQQLLDVELQKALDHLCTINYELVSTNQKLDQLSISKLWELG